MKSITKIDFQWASKIPLRDGIHLNATVYRPKDQRAPGPCVLTLTPYISDTFHERGVYFASRGLPFVVVDARGRGNSEGVFRPNIQEAEDGYDAVEWLARQSYCNGQVAMWGGSYGGHNQWVVAKEFPPHLTTIVPVAAPFISEDFPTRGGAFSPYVVQWLTFTSGHALQTQIFQDNAFWLATFREMRESGRPFRELDTFVGNPSATFQEWLSHRESDAYWDAYNPTADQYARLRIPVLTITGSYDANQPGALKHYKEHLRNASRTAAPQHYLIIGPWDHAGTRTPRAEFGGLKFGPASLVDLPQLHIDWYAWTMQNGPRPQFLKKNVCYYVMGAEKWRYADTLDAVTARLQPLYLQSNGNPTDVFKSGSLSREPVRSSEVDHYCYDPRDVSLAMLESTWDFTSLVDQHLLHASVGKQLVYHSEPFEEDTEVSGFFKLSLWLSIDQPDTDFSAAIYEIGVDGGSILLAMDFMRARYRESRRDARLIHTVEALRYDFEHFTFVSRQIKRGHRLRLRIGPVDSVYSETNYNSGGVVCDESARDARPVRVRLVHDELHPSALYVPLGQPDTQGEV